MSRCTQMYPKISDVSKCIRMYRMYSVVIWKEDSSLRSQIALLKMHFQAP